MRVRTYHLCFWTFKTRKTGAGTYRLVVTWMTWIWKIFPWQSVLWYYFDKISSWHNLPCVCVNVLLGKSKQERVAGPYSGGRLVVGLRSQCQGGYSRWRPWRKWWGGWADSWRLMKSWKGFVGREAGCLFCDAQFWWFASVFGIGYCCLVDELAGYQFR